MAIHVALSHMTEYRYDRPVSLSPHIVRLRPAPHCRTPILSYALRLTPQKHFINWQQDPHSNYLARVIFPEPTRRLSVEVDLVAEMSVFNPFDFFLEPSAERSPFRYEPVLAKDLAPYLEVAAPGRRLREFLATIDLAETRTIDFLVDINRRLAREVAYIIRLQPGVQTPDETLACGRGSCRDTGWLLVQVLRHLGYAARFVSGYLIQLVPDVKSLEGPTGPAADFTDLHAWAEVYLPGAGWIGLDPTSGLLAGEGHIPLAATPEPSSAAPVTGEVDECEVAFSHEMSVRRIYESPRVTRPYTEEQWRQIESVGYRLDDELSKSDVRLTMGGEPTFVSIDDMDGAEWNFTAIGPRKRELAGVLVKRLKKQFAPGGLLHYGQGKWYPGESLPRWTLGCWWRPDGVPIWKDDTLVADETVDYGYGEAEARRFVDTLADRLGVERRYAIPAYEDVWYHLWKERRLPVNVDPLKSKLEDEEERARLAQIFEQGLDAIVGYVLPLERDDAARWISGPWFFRSERLFLLPGDSPIGYRLPLDSLPWAAPDEHTRLRETDLSVALPPLPTQRYLQRPAGMPSGGGSIEPPRARRGESAPGAIRTALCVEPRQGRLHVFMPPVDSTEEYLELVAAVEETAATLKTPVILEGTPPGSDVRLEHINVTPDPGVIEVNLQPAHSWKDLVSHTTTLYEEARQSRLEPKSSWSTAGTPAPAGAITSSWVVRHLRTARSCGGPICCAACLATGTTIRPFRISSRVCSSARRASIRAWTRPGTMRSTSWKLPSPRFPITIASHRGSSTGSSATCSWMSPAIRTARSSASTSCTRPTRAAAGRVSWSCARSRCRRTPA